ncbi:MAG: YdhR family protein [Bryobacterales bacterium]|nr:YdhR family protein [Bryobacterales bacterium]
MLMQIVTFHLTGMTSAEYAHMCEDKLAAVFEQMPGLVSKAWLSNPETNTYGGVYMWQDQASLDAYKAGPIFQSLPEMPFVTGVTSQEFGLLEEPSRRCRALSAFEMAAVGAQ